MKSPDFNQKYDVLKTELANTGVVADVARSNYAITIQEDGMAVLTGKVNQLLPVIL